MTEQESGSGTPRLYEPLLHIVLVEPEIPPNTGNVGRTCVALGAKLWLVRPLGFDVDQKALRRAGLDYWQHLEWQVVENWEELCRHLDSGRMWFFSKRATNCYTDVSFQRGDVLVFGKETAGLPDELLNQYPDQGLRIPTRSQVRSLNLSCSVGVASFEARRQIELE